MRVSNEDARSEQLHMPGMPPLAGPAPNASARNVEPGTRVLFIGFAPYGLRQGSSGVVTCARGRRASVDMGHSGVWHIPYHLLSVPARAA